MNACTLTRRILAAALTLSMLAGLPAMAAPGNAEDISSSQAPEMTTSTSVEVEPGLESSGSKQTTEPEASAPQQTTEPEDAALLTADMGDAARDINVAGITVTAGSEELTSEHDTAENVLDGDPGTLWHTAWGGTAAENLWIDFDLGGTYAVDGLRYLPRSGVGNGTIKGYEILYSKNGTDYYTAASGTWDQTNGWKSASFGPVTATHIRLLAKDSVGGFASAAEIRVTGDAYTPTPDYTASFTDESSRGGWQKAAGGGTIAFTDGADAAGFAELQAAGNTEFYGADAPVLKDGYVQADITPLESNERFALLFRYADAAHYAGIGYDGVSKWNWYADGGTKWGAQPLSTEAVPQAGTKLTLRIEYTGENVRVLVDGRQIFLGAIPALNMADGRVGVRLWGTGAGATQGHIRLDNVSAGELDAPVELPKEPIAETDYNGDYTVTFTDEQRRGGWTAATPGSGSVTFSDGEGGAGRMRVAKADDGNQQKMYAYDASSPSLADGFVEMDLTNDGTQGRIGVLFRYQDPQHYAAVCNDTGNAWTIKQGTDANTDGVELATFTAPALAEGKKVRLRVEFTGEHIRVLLDGAQVYDGTVTGIRTEAGRMGVTTWGYGAGATQGKALVDNTTTGLLPIPETDGHGNYKISFTDRQRRGGFHVASGGGTVTFTDGEGDQGYMVVAKNGNDDKSKLIAVAGGSPVTRDGFVEMDVTNQAQGRLGFVFRHDGAHYAAVCYDVDGAWKVIKDGADVETGIAAAPLNGGVPHHVRVDFAGGRVTLTVDGAQQFSKRYDALEGMAAGQVGVMAWGYLSGATQGKLKVDNVVVGRFQAVSLSPDSASFSYEEAGTQDITTRLSTTENALTGISMGNTPLTEGTGYTVAGDAVTLKGELITDAVKDAGGATFTFSFADGYETNFLLRVAAKPQEHQISYTRDFSSDPTAAGFMLAKGSGTLTYQSDRQVLLLENGQDAFLVDENSPDLKNCDVQFSILPKTDGGAFAAVARYTGGGAGYAAIGNSGCGYHKTNWNISVPGGGENNVIPAQDGGLYLAVRTKPYTIRVRFLEDRYTIWVDGEEVFSGSSSALGGGAGKAGILIKGGQTAEISSFQVTSVDMPVTETQAVTEHTLSSDAMDVVLDGNFPRVIRYEMKGDLSGKTLPGQELPYYVVELNGKEYRPAVAAAFTGTTATYHLSAAIDETRTVTFDVVFTIDGNALQMEIRNVEDEAYPVTSFNFPRHSLVAVDSTQDGAFLRCANYTNHLPDSEVEYGLATRTPDSVYLGASIAVLGGDGLAASINNGSFNSHRGVVYQTLQAPGHTTTGLWSNGYTYRGLDGKRYLDDNGQPDNPWVRVSITGDRNGDGRVDFQDGAITRRDDCLKDGAVPDLKNAGAVMGSLNTIAMDVGSAAQYPFLRIQDNIQKLSLGLDGFPQTVIIKGYNGQGHDSNNNDFANYNEAAGGLADFNTLLSNAEKYNAKIGIHVNHTETYPESVTYGKLASTVTGWPWYDVAKIISRTEDALDESSGGMDARLEKLNEDTHGKLALVYVDVYYATRWPLYALTNKLNSMGIAVATEYANEMDRQSVWSHHIGEGEIKEGNAGNLIRFVNNQTQDIFGPSPLFRTSGNRNALGINGWQGSTDYSGTLKTFYTQVLPNRFLVQYPIMNWDDNTSVTLGKERNVVTKMENGVNVITLDGKKVAEGDKIFIPFTVSGTDKIYHWNPTGGETTWDLPATFAGQASVKVFQLSDHGRTNLWVVPVENGKVTVNAQAGTPYVVYKGDSDVAETDLSALTWTDGGLVHDAGFDSFAPGKAWTLEHAEYWDNNRNNTYLVMNGTEDGSAVQTISGLTPGRNYQASVWAEVRDKTASITVTPEGGAPVSNHMDRSNVVYGLHHTDKQGRFLQRMWVEFTAPASGTAVLSLTGVHGKDSGAYVHFDDVRVVEHTLPDKGSHTYYEDFEHVTEGYGPFTTTESDKSHLSETNHPYTFDTIEGRYSLKTMAGDYLRTMPYTVRLAPNTEYEAGLQYKGGAAGDVFTLAVKSDQAREAGDTAHAQVASKVCAIGTGWSPASQPGAVSLRFTTGDYDDYYIDITKIQTQYCIDNFYVDEIHQADKASLQELYDACAALSGEDYTAESWSALQAEFSAAKAVLDDPSATQEGIQLAQDGLRRAKDALVAYAKEADLARLRTVIGEMKAISGGDYHPDAAWTAFQNKITEAEDLAAQTDPKPTVPQVDAMIQALRDAKAALHSLVDKTALQSLCDVCGAIVSGEVVDGNELQAFLSARTSADAVLIAEGKTQAEVDAAHGTLLEAYSKIMPKPDASVVTALAEKKAAAEAVVDPSGALTAAIAKAGSAKTWKEMDEAIAALDAAMPGGPEPVTGVSLDRAEAALYTNGTPNTVQLTATVEPQNAGDKTVTWTSSDASVAGVDQNGLVTAKAVGTATVTAAAGGHSAACEITVTTYAYSGSDGSKTETAKNPDGSTTTTVTRPNGTVTATTKWPDGSKEIVETKKDGTITETLLDKDGSSSKTVTTAAGTVTEVKKGADGTASTSSRKPDGTASAQASIPATAVAGAADRGEGLTVKTIAGSVSLTAETVSARSGEPIAVKLEVLPAAEGGREIAAVTLSVTAQGEAIAGAAARVDLSPLVGNGAAPGIVAEADGKIIIGAYLSGGELVLPASQGTITIRDNSKAFTDVAQGNWAEDAIQFVAARELFTGTSGTTFSPQAPTTRGMVMTVLARAAGQDTSGGASWYEKGMDWAREQGISDGAMPEANVSREQLVTMLYRWAGSPSSAGALDGFEDVGSVSGYARAAVAWAVEEGILTGKGGKAIDPQAQATRAEVSAMLARFLVLPGK